MTLRLIVLVGLTATLAACQTLPQAAPPATYNAPKYSDISGKWKLVKTMCSDGTTPAESSQLTGTLDFQDKKALMTVASAKKPNAPETTEMKNFVLQDNLFTYVHKHGASTIEMRLYNNGELMLRSPLIGLSGDCKSSTALMEMTYNKM